MKKLLILAMLVAACKKDAPDPGFTGTHEPTLVDKRLRFTWSAIPQATGRAFIMVDVDGDNKYDTTASYSYSLDTIFKARKFKFYYGSCAGFLLSVDGELKMKREKDDNYSTVIYDLYE